MRSRVAIVVTLVLISGAILAGSIRSTAVHFDPHPLLDSVVDEHTDPGSDAETPLPAEHPAQSPEHPASPDTGLPLPSQRLLPAGEDYRADYDNYLETVLALELRRRGQSLWLDGTSLRELYVPKELLRVGKAAARLIHQRAVTRAVPAHAERCYHDVMSRPDRINVTTEHQKAQGVFSVSGPGLDEGTTAIAGAGLLQTIRFDVKRGTNGEPLWNLCGDTLLVRALLHPRRPSDGGRTGFFDKQMPAAAVRVDVVDWFNGTYTGTLRLPACLNSTRAGVWTLEVVHAFHRFNGFGTYAGLAPGEAAVTYLDSYMFLDYRVAHASLAQPCSVGAADTADAHPPLCRGARNPGAWVHGTWLPYACRFSPLSAYELAQTNAFNATQRARFDACFEEQKLCFAFLGASLTRGFFEGLMGSGMRAAPNFDYMGSYGSNRPDVFWANSSRAIFCFNFQEPIVSRSASEGDTMEPTFARCFARMAEFVAKSECLLNGGTLVLVPNFGVHSAALNRDYGQFTVGFEIFLMMLRLQLPQAKIVYRRVTAVHEYEYARIPSRLKGWRTRYDYQNSMTHTRIDVFDQLSLRSLRHHGVPVFDVNSFSDAAAELLGTGDIRHYEPQANYLFADAFRTFVCEGPALKSLADYRTLDWPVEGHTPPNWVPNSKFREDVAAINLPV